MEAKLLRQIGALTTRAPLSRPNEKLILLATDLLVFLFAFVISGLLLPFYSGSAPDIHVLLLSGDTQQVLFGGSALLCIAWLLNDGHYSHRLPFWAELRDVLRVLFFIAIIDAALLFLVRSPVSRTWFAGGWLLVFLMLPFFRMIAKHSMAHFGDWRMPTVVLGTGPNAIRTARALNSEPFMGLVVNSFVAIGDAADIPEHLELDDRCVDVIPLGQHPWQALDGLGYPNIIVALENDDYLKYETEVTNLCRDQYRNVSIVPSIKSSFFDGMVPERFFTDDMVVLRRQSNLGNVFSRLVKRSFDIVGAASLLVLLSPLYAYIAWQVRKTGDEIFYRHRRIGRNNKPFECLKFRTMVPNAAQILEDLLASDAGARAEWADGFKLKNDPRITGIGSMLRRTSLDELPQLINVLRGEMSLVGPRPVVHAELERYGSELEYYLSIRPGMTGLWQISGRNKLGYVERVTLDTWYVRNWSLWHDFVILLKTVRVVLKQEGAY